MLNDRTEKLWWDYIHEFHAACHNEVTEGCSKNAHEAVGLDYKKTSNCVK